MLEDGHAITPRHFADAEFLGRDQALKHLGIVLYLDAPTSLLKFT